MAIPVWKIFDVTVGDFPAVTITAPTRGRALAEALSSYQIYDDRMTFGQFIRIVRIRVRREPPAPDGYDYIRRAYGLDPKIGQRCRLHNEGPKWEGREGVVVYPGQSTAHVRIAVEGIDHPLSVHPHSVELIA